MRWTSCVLAWLLCGACASAGPRPPVFAGAVAGISTLSADARAILTPAGADVSLYKPENGGALNLFGGVHVSDYFSVQGNYVWNRNRLTLSSVRSADDSVYEDRRESTQHALVADGLLYFRDRESWARPYLSAGVGVVRFASGEPAVQVLRGSPVRPTAAFRSTDPALRVAVGIDVGPTRGWRFRYSFSETIAGNPISVRLTPRAQRNLANFQNLFGAVATF